MDVNIDPSWKAYLENEFTKPYFKKLVAFVENEYQTHQCYPEASDIFAAFDYCTFDNVKVVIIGQDPYHGPGQANGLCFSVNEGISLPPSLQNIFKEIESDLNESISKSGNLQRWAEQGVLLLNATLTVKANQAGSHQKQGWEQFTDTIISLLSEQKEGLVFMLWGGFAKKKGKKIDRNKHLVLESGHPSPLSANRGYWFGHRHFSRANTYLTQLGKDSIKW
ncbi:uracil-DNA glycosylase [Aquimarina brevivitae]|uniref:Uracil-DNA glycosylase n=1 Tax=Aquimarina brevivitae TaxID=323412 RepID=A0A4Q7NU99_9FLAO|nr:uracil-DNA glycosylase [Aquimarina brevivitae]RZS90665.1 uracil-DNA glycosylase [Aquimarina brevivitae]